MLLEVDPVRETFDHMCQHCKLVQRGLRIHPDHGELLLMVDNDTGRVCNFGVICPVCTSGEVFRLDIQPWEAGEGHHPDSMVGHVFPDTGGVVGEHDLGGYGHPMHRHQAQRILALKRHPHIAHLL